VALENPEQMLLLEQPNNEQYQYLQRRGVEPADKDAFAVLDRTNTRSAYLNPNSGGNTTTTTHAHTA
jgi:hypothetical protein